MVTMKEIKEKKPFFLGSHIYNRIKFFFQINLEKTFINTSYISILSMNFENIIFRLHVFIIFFMHVKFQEDQRSIVISFSI